MVSFQCFFRPGRSGDKISMPDFATLHLMLYDLSLRDHNDDFPHGLVPLHELVRLPDLLQRKHFTHKHLFPPRPALHLPHHLLHHPRHFLQSRIVLSHAVKRQLPRRRYLRRGEVPHAPALGQHARHDGGAVAREVREGEGEEPVGADEFEDAVDAVGVEAVEAGVEVRFEEDVVSACGFERVGFLGLPRRGDDGAVVVLGEEDRPQAHAARAAVHEDRGVGLERGGFEQRSPCRPHAHEDAAQDVPGQGRGGYGETAPRVADGVLSVRAIVSFAAAVDPAGDTIAWLEGC